MKHPGKIILMGLRVFTVFGCQAEPKTVLQETSMQVLENHEAGTYQSVSMEDAMERFGNTCELIIVDVRRPDEFAEGHIPGAVNIPNETITDTMPEELPNLNRTVYVYCRGGNRSKQAAQKLADMGYTAIIECGGILDYTGELAK